LREAFHSARCRVNALQKCVEIGSGFSCDQQLAIGNELLRTRALERCDDLRKIPG